MIVELTVKDLAERLEVKPETIRSYDNKNILNDKLELIDGRIVDKRKEGRSTTYIIEISEKYDLDYICRKNKIKNKEKLKTLILMRKDIIEGLIDIHTQSEIANMLNCSRDLIRKMDEILIDNNFMLFSGYIHYKKVDGMIIEISEKEYNSNMFEGYAYRKANKNNDIRIRRDEVDKIKSELRREYAQFIIPIVKQTQCEVCKCRDNLIVHHEIPFNTQFEDCINELCLNEKETINAYELNLIKHYMLGKQIKYKNTTLCEKCHLDKHNDMRTDIIKGDKDEFKYKKIKRYIKGCNYEKYIDDAVL